MLKAREKDEDSEKKLAETEKPKKKKDSELSEARFDDIGLTVRDLSESIEKSYKVENGILVKKVDRFSKAANQRLFEGLVIVEVDKEKINSVDEFEEIIEDKKGSAILLKVQDRNGNTSFVGLEIPE